MKAEFFLITALACRQYVGKLNSLFSSLLYLVVSHKSTLINFLLNSQELFVCKWDENQSWEVCLCLTSVVANHLASDTCSKILISDYGKSHLMSHGPVYKNNSIQISPTLFLNLINVANKLSADQHSGPNGLILNVIKLSLWMFGCLWKMGNRDIFKHTIQMTVVSNIPQSYLPYAVSSFQP